MLKLPFLSEICIAVLQNFETKNLSAILGDPGENQYCAYTLHLAFIIIFMAFSFLQLIYCTYLIWILVILFNLLLLRLLQVVPFFTLLIIYHINVAMMHISIKKELESTFTEIVNLRKSNIIVEVIHRHLSMDLADFNCNI